MPHRSSRSRSRASALGFLLALVLIAPQARAQACCAGTSALTPGRLALHEDALVGGGLRVASMLGSWDDSARYTRSPPGTSELDFEQDVFGAVRVLERGQVALLVPVVETRRVAGGRSELGGGIGDVNLSVRYDFFPAGRSRVIPGIAALAGVTAPTGRSPDEAKKTLATDATGVGAYQLNGGVALEQVFGHWLFNLTGLVQKRTSRSVRGVSTTLGTRFTGLVGVAYTFPSGAALAFFGSYAAEGSAVVDGVAVDGTAQHVVQASVGGMVPLSEKNRLQGNLFIDPPFNGFGRNQPALGGANLTFVRSFW